MKVTSRVKRFVFKVTIILVAAFLINISTSGISKTYSWFYDNKTSSASASVADASNIINVKLRCDLNEDGYVDSVYNLIPRQQVLDSLLIRNPVEIEVTRLDPLSNPCIYFDVSGTVANYTLQIHPVDFLSQNSNGGSNDTRTVKIVRIANMYQDSSLKNTTYDTEKGKLSIRYLNKFINDEINIEFTDKFLKSRVNVNISNN